MAITDTVGDSVSVEVRTPNLRAGRYVVGFVDAQAGTSKKSGQDYLRVTVNPTEAKGEDPSKVGQDASIFISADKYKRHEKQIAALIRALTNEPTATNIGTMLKNLLSNPAAAKGEKFEVEAVVKPGVFFADGTPVLNFTFTPYTTSTTLPPANGATTKTAQARK